MTGSAGSELNELSKPSNAPVSYVQALRRVYNNSPRIPDPAKAPKDDPSWWRKALRDPTIRKAVMKRTYAVAGREWRIMPATDTSPPDKAVASIAEEAFDQIRLFDHARAMLARAIFRGRAYSAIYGERRFMQLGHVEGVPLAPRWWWVPTFLKDVDPNRFELRRDPTDEQVKWYFGNVTEDLDPKGNNAYGWEVLEHPEWFVRHVYEPSEQSLAYGEGLQDALEFSLWAKQDLWRNFLSGARRAGRGFFDVATDDLREGSTDEALEQTVEDWKAVLEISREDGDIIHSKQDEIKPLPMPHDGLQIIRQTVLDINEEMTSLILFGVLPTGGGSANGSFARAETEADQGREAFYFDQSSLSESINDGVGALFFNLNRANFESLNLAGARPGRFEIVNEPKPDAKAAAGVVKELISAGARLRLDEVLERCGGWTPPKAGEDVLEPIAPAAAEQKLVDPASVASAFRDSLREGLGGGLREVVREVVRELLAGKAPAKPAVKAG